MALGYEHGQLVEPGPYDLLFGHGKVPGSPGSRQPA
jgi:hypothetical protein